MKKKLITITLLILMFLAMPVAHAADIATYTFTDDSTIVEDIKVLNLDLNDYILKRDVDYDITNVIASAEFYDDAGNVGLYIYTYNPYENYLIDAFDITIKGTKKKYDAKYISSDKNHNIRKSKIENVTTYSKESFITEREYTINLIYYRKKVASSDVTDLTPTYISATQEENFNLKIGQNGDKIEFNIDSYLFIEDKELVDYCVDIGLGFDTIFDDFWQRFDPDSSKRPQLFFLNFDTNKKIDKIHEIDVAYKVIYGRTKECPYGFGFSIKNPIVEVINDNYAKYTLANPKTIYADKQYEYDWFHYSGSLDMISSPASKRFTNDQMDYYFDNNTKLSTGLTAKQSFTKRQHSVLIDALEYDSCTLPLFVYTGYHLKKYQIEDASITRILYETDNILYNARTNSGKPISSEGGNEEPESLLDKILRVIQWIIDNITAVVFGLLFGIIVLIIVVMLVWWFIKSGAKLIAKLIIFIIKSPFKILFYGMGKGGK